MNVNKLPNINAKGVNNNKSQEVESYALLIELFSVSALSLKKYTETQ